MHAIVRHEQRQLSEQSACRSQRSHQQSRNGCSLPHSLLSLSLVQMRHPSNDDQRAECGTELTCALSAFGCIEEANRYELEKNRSAGLAGAAERQRGAAHVKSQLRSG